MVLAVLETSAHLGEGSILFSLNSLVSVRGTICQDREIVKELCKVLEAAAGLRSTE